jgi:sodium transport system permease protein
MSVARTDSAASRILAVVAKELTDMFRDRRTAMVTLVSAIAAGPVFLILIFNLIANQAERATDLKVSIVGREHAPALATFLERQQVIVENAPADYEAKVREGDLDVVLVIDDKFAEDVAQGRPGTVRLVFDRSRTRAQPTVDQAEALLRAYNRLWGQQRLILRGIASSVGNPLAVEEVDLSTPQQSGALVLFMVAYYGLFSAILGGLAVALDTTAGERERQSLEPLLTTPARAIEIVVGKWVAVALFDLVVVLLTLTGFYVTLALAPLPPVGIPFLFGMREFLRFLVVLLPLIFCFSAILLFVGSRARAFREAQANVSVLVFVISILPLVQYFLQRKEPDWIALVPVSGQYHLLGIALRGDPLPLNLLALAWLSPIVIAILLVLAVARLLRRESILAGH